MAGYSNSNYAKTSMEYTDKTGANVGIQTVHKGHYIDTSQSSESAIASQVCKIISQYNIAVNRDDFFAVFTDQKRGSAGYCAWHSAATCGGTVVQLSFYWDLTDDAGCSVRDLSTGHSAPLAALANVAAHELAEAMTDPIGLGGGWWDSKGWENGDKCAWAFGSPYVGFPATSYTDRLGNTVRVEV